MAHKHAVSHVLKSIAVGIAGFFGFVVLYALFAMATDVTNTTVGKPYKAWLQSIGYYQSVYQPECTGRGSLVICPLNILHDLPFSFVSVLFLLSVFGAYYLLDADKQALRDQVKALFTGAPMPTVVPKKEKKSWVQHAAFTGLIVGFLVMCSLFLVFALVGLFMLYFR